MQSYVDDYMEKIKKEARQKAWAKAEKALREQVQKEVQQEAQKEALQRAKHSVLKCYSYGISIQVIAECLEYPEEKVISWLKAEGIQL
jgi:predicted lipoprotein